MSGGLDPLAFEAKSHRFGGGFFLHLPAAGSGHVWAVFWRTDCLKGYLIGLLRSRHELPFIRVKP
jgi:hypothetical protein